MSLKSFISRMLPGLKPMPPSEALFHHVEGTGTGFEVDDLISRGASSEVNEKAIGPLLDINERYRSAEYPIGVSDPASFAEIRALAERLRSEGL